LDNEHAFSSLAEIEEIENPRTRSRMLALVPKGFFEEVPVELLSSCWEVE